MNARQRDLEKLKQEPMATLLARYAEVFGKPPRAKNRAHLAKRIAWKMEEQRSGGLSKKAKERLDELIAKLDIDLGDRRAAGRVTAGSRSIELAPGTTIRRRWKSHDIVVRVLEDGFDHEGRRYGSLTAVAKAITGQHLSGPAFFGLSKRMRR